MFLQRFPTPESVAQAGKRQWQKFLYSRRLRGSDQGPRRMEVFARVREFAGTPPTVKAKSLLALSLVQMLFAVEKQLGLYRQRIEELFARHPDHDLFNSLPGAGPKIAPRLLSEIGDDRQRFGGQPQNLQCLAGTAPVTKRSGKQRQYRHVQVAAEDRVVECEVHNVVLAWDEFRPFRQGRAVAISGLYEIGDLSEPD